ncbi:glycosyltransferase family 4 protein [bacterium]|nr:glycosyltransferase family 4 protein [bacterium]
MCDNSSVLDLLVFCPSSFGGIPDYAHYQAESIARLGVSVRMLCPLDYPHQAVAYQQERCLPENGNRPRSKIWRMASLVREMLSGYAILAKRIQESDCRSVLFASYGEYLAPIWARQFRKLQQKGVCFGAVVHDPVRDFVLGPKWWHQWSISEGYSFLDHGFVHEAIQLDTGSRGQSVLQTVIPHGPYSFPDPNRSREDVRKELGISAEANLFLCFGHLRDGKNLNLILKALPDISNAWLLVAGSEAGSGHHQSKDYRKMAEELGVASRCRWEIGFASPKQVANYFEAADFTLLTYEARFRSASGVLNVAARYRRPVVASCGEGNLASAVRNYHLGPWVKPDCSKEIARGMIELLNSQGAPEWDRYMEENSWGQNARLVVDTMKLKSSECL